MLLVILNDDDMSKRGSGSSSENKLPFWLAATTGIFSAEPGALMYWLRHASEPRKLKRESS